LQSKKTKAMLQAEVEQTVAVAAAKVRAAEERVVVERDNAAAERANAERMARSLEDLQQRVAATEAAQRALSAQSQRPTPSTTCTVGADAYGTESYKLSAQQVNSLIAQLQADQPTHCQYGLRVGSFAGLVGQPHSRDAAPSSRFGPAEPAPKKAKAEMSLQELVALRTNRDTSISSGDRPVATAVQVESMFRDYVAFATTMKVSRSAVMRRLLLLMYITTVGYECHKDRDPNHRDEVVEGSMHVMHTMVRELHAFESASPYTDLHVKLQRLNGAIAQAADSVAPVYGDKARAWLPVPGSGYGSWR
jgi:hypothetical protein